MHKPLNIVVLKKKWKARFYLPLYFVLYFSWGNIYGQDFDFPDPDLQNSPAEMEKKLTIVSIEFEGLLKYKKKDLLESLPIQVGDYFDPALVSASVSNLIAEKDLFYADIRVRPHLDSNEVDLIYTIEEKPFIHKRILEGNKAISNMTLDKLLLNKKGKFYDAFYAKADVRSIEQAYLEQGFVGTHVDIEESRDKKNRYILTYRVHEGVKIEVQKVDFIGLKSLSADMLLASLARLNDRGLFYVKQPILLVKDFEAEIAPMFEVAKEQGFLKFQIQNLEIALQISLSDWLGYFQQKPLLASLNIQKEIWDHLKELDWDAAISTIEAQEATLSEKEETDKEEIDLKNPSATKPETVGSLLKNMKLEIIAMRKLVENLQYEMPRYVHFSVEVKENAQMGFYVVFDISEGEAYTLGNVELFGLEEQEVKILEAKKDVRSYEIYKQSDVSRYEQMIYDYFQNKGYLMSTVRWEYEYQEIGHRVDLRGYVYKGKPVFVESMEIGGETRTEFQVIDREMKLYEGDLFQASKIRQTQYNLMRLGFFKQVVPQVEPGTQEGLFHIRWDLEEGETGSINLGGGYGTQVGFSLYGNVADNNFLGKGLKGNVGLEWGQNSRQVSLGLRSDYIGYTPVRWGMSLGYNWTRVLSTPKYDRNQNGYWDKVVEKNEGEYVFLDQNEAGDSFYDYVDQDKDGSFVGNFTSEDILSFEPTTSDYGDNKNRKFERDSIFFSTDIGYTFASYYSIGTVANFSFFKYHKPSNINVEYLYEDTYYHLRRYLLDQTFNYSSNLVLYFKFDNTDQALSPTQGAIQSLAFQAYGFAGGVNKFLKFRDQNAVYYPLIRLNNNWALVWAFGLALETILGTVGKEEIEYEELVTFTPTQEVRGWSMYLDDDKFRGLSKISLGTELRMPIPGTGNLLSALGFFDAGGISNKISTLPLDFKNFFYSTGLGLRVDIPSFPIRFYFAQRLKWGEVFWKREGGITFEFAIFNSF